jgi:hypothetical protein
VIKHRQLARQVRVFGAIAFKSSVDLKIKIRCGSHRPSLMTRRVYISVTCGDSVSHGGVRRRPSASLQSDSASGVQEQACNRTHGGVRRRPSASLQSDCGFRRHLFKSKAKSKSRSKVQFSVLVNHQVRADVQTNKKLRAAVPHVD